VSDVWSVIVTVISISTASDGANGGDDGCVSVRRIRLVSGSPAAPNETVTAAELGLRAAGTHIVARVVLVGKGTSEVAGQKLSAAYTEVALRGYSLDLEAEGMGRDDNSGQVILGMEAAEG
jgi:hypothetical protein